MRAVAYASVFEYPLEVDEVHRTLVGLRSSAAQVLAACQTSPWLRARIEHRDGFLLPRGREQWIRQRREREAASLTFLRSQRGLLRLLCLLPFVRLLAISGSLAHLNAGPAADLDLFIVTRGRRVWSVTLAIVLLAKLLGRRRTLCANFVVADGRLAIEEQDLFVANQVIHLKPLVGANLCATFVSANPFVGSSYPNFTTWTELPLSVTPGPLSAGVKRMIELILAVPSPAVEWLSRRAYGWHLRRQAARWQSPEQVRLNADYLKLHTQSHRHSVLDRYDDALACLDQRDSDETRARIAV